MKKILSFVFFLSLSFTLLAAPSTIKGTVIDGGTQAPLDFVNVALFKTGSEKPIKGVISDKNGIFSFSSISEGKYTIKLSFVGYKTTTQELTLNGTSVNLGKIKLEENSKKLGEVEVVGQSSQMHFDVDKKVFSVDQNISSAGGSATDVLKNIPSVTVDNQGNVALRKDGNVEVWINGKASGLTADNRAQVLQQLPAESIESVEIMTNPSAKFNPEGSAGIINIVMKKNRKAGYYGSVSAGINVPDNFKLGKNIGASVNYTSSKIDAYINLGYRAMSFQGGGKTNRRNFSAKDTTLLLQDNTMSTSFSGLFLRAGVDYHLDTKNTLSVSGFGMGGDGNQSSNTHNLKSELNNPSAILANYTQNNVGSGTRPSLNMNLDYHHDFDKKGSNLNARIGYSSHNRTGNTDYIKNDSIFQANSRTNQKIDNKNTEWEFKLDYTNKLSETSKLEAGWESNLSNKLSTSSGFNYLTNLDMPAYFDNFNYNEQTHAGYLTYGNRIDKLTFQLGLRAEWFLNGSTNTYKSISNRSIDTLNVIPQNTTFHAFPSFYLSYTLPQNAELQFNYSNRVNRPRGQQINPFKNFSDSTNISYGKPDLSPQYSSSLELNYIKTWDAQTLSASLYYHKTNDVIESVHFLNKNNVMESTFANVSKSQNTGLELISKNRLFRILSLTSTVNLYYSKLDSATYVNPYDKTTIIPMPGQSGFSWSANVMANFMLSKTFSGQITGEYESPQLISQGKENAKYSIDLGVRQNFMDRNLSVSLNIRDLLNSDKDNQTTSGSGFYQNSTSYFHGRMLGLTVTYNFGNMKPKQGDMKKKQGGGDMNMDTGVE